MNKCEFCGDSSSDSMVNIEPIGICCTCMWKNKLPKHIRYEQTYRYYKMLIEKKKK